MSSTDENDVTGEFRSIDSAEFESVPAPSQSRAIISTIRDLPNAIKRGVTTQPEDNELPSVPMPVRIAGNIAYGFVGTIVVIFIAIALITLIVWFATDLSHINTHLSSSDVRNQVINASANLLANLMLVLILLEVVSALMTFLRTRHANARPLLLIPLFIVARGVILLVNQLLTSPPALGDYNALYQPLAEMGALALVGLFLSVSLAVLRDPPNNKSSN